MDLMLRQKTISRIISGKICDSYIFNGIEKEVVFAPISREQKDKANIIYQEALDNSYALGAYSYSELLPFTRWEAADQTKYDKIVSDVSEMKVMIYESFFNSNRKQTIKNNIKGAEKVLRTLFRKKNSHETYTCEGIAKVCKLRYFISQSTYINGHPLFSNQNYKTLIDYNNVLDSMLGLYSNNILEESTYRYLARNDPWRSVWNLKKSSGSVFGGSAVDLTDEQQTLAIWSGMYDNINESTERPCQEIIDDDDSIDGWMIVQGRKMEEDQKKSGMKSLGLENDKTGREVFVPAQTAQDVNKINNLNSAQSKGEKRERANYIKGRGVVREKDLPETKRALTRQAIQMRKDKG